MTRMLSILRAAGAATLCALSATGQNPVPAAVPTEEVRTEGFRTEVDVLHVSPATAAMKIDKGMTGPQMQTFAFVSADMSMDARTVKGAPYSAEAVTETTQVLADGNRISRKTKAFVYRDGEGRTRREQTFGAIGPWASAGEAPSTVFINDPVSKTHYILNAGDKTARKLPAPQMLPDAFSEAQPVAGRRSGTITSTRVHSGSADVIEESGAFAGVPLHAGTKKFDFALPEPKVEKLGKRTIEGVVAEGTRTTMTIPAGQVGNERAIDVTSERWYSPELQTVVMTTHNDPRMGETVYKITQLQLGEPSPALFEVSADYKTVEDMPRIPNRRMHRIVEK